MVFSCIIGLSWFRSWYRKRRRRFRPHDSPSMPTRQHLFVRCTHRLLVYPSRPLSSHLKCHTNSLPSLAAPQVRATSTAVILASLATCMTARQSSPRLGFTFRRTRILLCIQAFRTPLYVLYSPFVPEHRLAHSVHVHNPPRLAPTKQARIQPHFPFLFPLACVRLKSFVTPVTNPQLCCWSQKCRAHHGLGRHVQPPHPSSGSGALSHHTHIYIC